MKAVPLLVLAALPAAIALAAVPFFGGRRRGGATAVPGSEGAPEIGLSKRLLDASQPQDVAVLLLDAFAERFQLDVDVLPLEVQELA